jgi:hypothetical protein
MDDLLNSIEEGWQVDSVYTDFPKVFDRVRHQLLPEEMCVGIEPTRSLWLRSYLTGRFQRIRIGDAVSKDIRETSRVSQGSHLGPLSFIWFVNRKSVVFDLPIRASQDCIKIQLDLNKLSKWCEKNILENTLSCRVYLYGGWNCAGSDKLYKLSGGHHGRENEFFGACGRHDW